MNDNLGMENRVKIKGSSLAILLGLFVATVSAAEKTAYFKVKGHPESDVPYPLAIQIMEGRIVVLEKWLNTDEAMDRFLDTGIYLRHPVVDIQGDDAKNLWIRMVTPEESSPWEGRLDVYAVAENQQLHIPLLTNAEPKSVDPYPSYAWDAVPGTPADGGDFTDLEIDIPMELFQDITGDELHADLLFVADQDHTYSVANRFFTADDWNYYDGKLVFKLKRKLAKAESAKYRLRLSFSHTGTLSDDWKSAVRIRASYEQDVVVQGQKTRVFARIDDGVSPNHPATDRVELTFKFADITKKPF